MKLMARHPALKIDARFSDPVVDIVKEGLDAAARVGPLADSSLAGLEFDRQFKRQGPGGISSAFASHSRERSMIDHLGVSVRDHASPGIRAHYHPSYYGAFVIDLNGINLEAVCHTP
ncbi:MAG: hypothetical protein WDO68_24545 [Gammaproteobacteria bacterium]